MWNVKAYNSTGYRIPTYLVTATNVRLNQESVTFCSGDRNPLTLSYHDGEAASSSQASTSQELTECEASKACLITKPNVKNVICNTWINNYYHFFMDVFPSLYHLCSSETVVYATHTVSLTDFVQECCVLLGVRVPVCIELLHPSHVIPECHYITNTINIRSSDDKIPFFPVWTMREFAKGMAAKGIVKSEKSLGRIYISRKNSRERAIVNDDEVSNLLKKYGFQTVVLEECTVAMQIEMFMHCSIVVAPHGAGSINMCFSDSMRHYVELHDTNYVIHDSCFFQICDMLDIDYTCVHCEAVTHDAKNAHHSQLHLAELEHFEQLIISLLSLCH